MDNKYAGMTVNERLWISSLMDDFDRAVKDKKTDEVIVILNKAELTDENIEPILKNLGLK